MGGGGMIGTGQSQIGESLAFEAGDGMRWSVREYGDGGTAAERYLIFESDSVVRRVRVFPDTWRALSAVGLLALSWRV
jgi:hypothetical protein